MTGREGPKIENARPLLCQMCLWCASVCVCAVGALVCVVSDVSASEASLEDGGGGEQPSRQRQQPVKNRVRQNK